MNDFLFRVDVAGTLENLLARVVIDFRLGSIQSHKLLSDGYQELNVLITTNNGRFVVKIFSKEKTLQRIQDNVWGYCTFREEGVPLPVLRKTTSGKYIFSTKGRRRMTYLIIMEYYDGSYLYPRNATDNDICLLTDYMASIHSYTKRIHRYYDTMGIVNLVSQYNKFKSYLPPDLQVLVKPVVKEFSSLHLKELPHSIIHGTFEPGNILKNSCGELCLLDLGCMDYNASIVDIATFLANYTIDFSPDEKQKRTVKILTIYQKILPLTKQELHALPILVRAQYATILIRTNYYIQKKHDQSQQTKEWFSFGRRGLS